MYTLKLTEREQYALDMRTRGEPYRAISKTIGVSDSRTAIIIKKAKEKKACVAILEQLKTHTAPENIELSILPTINKRIGALFSEAGIVSLQDVLRLPRKELLKICKLHKTGVQRLEAALNILGYKLQD